MALVCDRPRRENTTAARRVAAVTALRELGWKTWWRVLRRTVLEIDRDQVPLITASVAFYAIFAVFPSLIALISIYGLVAETATLETQIRGYTAALPASAAVLVRDHLQELITASPSGLGISAVLGILVAFWGVSLGMTALMRAINIAYDLPEKRNVIQLRARGFSFGVGAIVFTAVSLALIAALPLTLAWAGLPGSTIFTLSISRWLVLGAIAVANFAVLYRYVPNRPPPDWRWVIPGAVAAVLLWLLASAGLGFYVTNISGLSMVEGTISGVFALLVWLYASTFALLIGAELNAELEAEVRASPPDSFE